MRGRRPTRPCRSRRSGPRTSRSRPPWFGFRGTQVAVVTDPDPPPVTRDVLIDLELHLEPPVLGRDLQLPVARVGARALADHVVLARRRDARRHQEHERGHEREYDLLLHPDLPDPGHLEASEAAAKGGQRAGGRSVKVERYPRWRRRQGAWWAPRSSKPVWGRELPGGFDSRPPPRVAGPSRPWPDRPVPENRSRG
jgi:hypothetical protein